MDAMQTGLDPAEFVATARRAAAACAGQKLAMQAARLAEDGLLGVLAGEEAGGLSLPVRFAAPVIGSVAASLLGLPLIETMLLARIAPHEIACSLVEGTTVGTIAWDGAVTARAEGDSVLLNGSAGRAPSGLEADWILVPLLDGGAALVASAAEGVTRGKADGFDLSAPDATVRLDAVKIAARHVVPPALWESLAADALVLRAAAMLGAAELCLAAAVQHATDRRQFGAALIANQAMRHLLARLKLRLESLRSVLARALDGAGATAPLVAFAAAAEHAPAIIEGAIQVHGGMGFTWDLDLHRHLRRVRMLEAHGNARNVRAALAASLIASAAA
ncbi:MAG TPA: acyl-CoA dehydrogenase family protein [Acetobacteraceae bacterium]|nr:acyl-CoA dehydrogenase family protein [Acetobacteraceae bacterium]